MKAIQYGGKYKFQKRNIVFQVPATPLIQESNFSFVKRRQPQLRVANTGKICAYHLAQRKTVDITDSEKKGKKVSLFLKLAIA